MLWLFGQIWLWLLIAFALGSGLTALVLRPRRRTREPAPPPPPSYGVGGPPDQGYRAGTLPGREEWHVRNEWPSEEDVPDEAGWRPHRGE